MNEWFAKRIVIENDCWLWQKATNKQGHGITTFKGKSFTAHRLSYVMHVGEIEDGLVVRHLCENKGCCNPEHLTLGTQKDNYYDIPEEKRKEMHYKTGVAQRGKKGMSSKQARWVASHRKTFGKRSTK